MLYGGETLRVIATWCQPCVNKSGKCRNEISRKYLQSTPEIFIDYFSWACYITAILGVLDVIKYNAPIQLVTA